MKFDLGKHLETIVGKAIGLISEIFLGSLAALFSHWVITKRDEKTGQPVLDKDGKPVKTLNMEAVRSEAPHFAKTKADETEFASLMTELGDSHRKALEDPKEGLPSFGPHQRTAIMFKINGMTARTGLHPDPIENRK